MIINKTNIKYITLTIIVIILLLIIDRNYTILEILHPDWFKDINKFPNDKFDCKTVSNCYSYNQIIDRGYKKMSESRVVFCGLCYNISSKVDNLIKRVEYTGSKFKDYSMVIFENDSTDNTRFLLKEWSKMNSKVYLVPCDEDIDCKLKRKRAIYNGPLSKNRMKTMSEYRNRLLNYILAYYHDYDYIIMFDLDIKGPWMIDGFAHSFGINKDWDGLFAYGLTSTLLTVSKPIYYDSLAYVDYNTDYYNGKMTDAFKVAYKLSNLKDKDLIPVNSAFAGIGIYRMSIFTKDKEIRYTPLDNNYICEHVILHNNMRIKGYNKLYINPYLVVLVGAQGPGA